MGKSVEAADGDIDHLYPLFAAKVRVTLEQANRETTGKFKDVAGWRLFEGYRSQGRQDYLYAQGRSRQGPIVTYKRTSNHSSALAADCYPIDSKGNILWDYEGSAWAIFGHCARANGLVWGGNWVKFVDQPHVEPPLWQRTLWKVPALLFLRQRRLG